MEQSTGSNFEMEFVKAVYCHPAYLTYVQTTSCKMPDYMPWRIPCTVPISLKSRVTIYSVDVFLSQFGTSLLFHVQFCCFLTCIQVSHEAGQVVWYSHLFKNFPQFVVIHTIKGFSVVNEAEVDVFLEFSCFFYDAVNVGNYICGSSAFSKSSLYLLKFTYCWRLTQRILRISLLACEMSAIVW